MSGASIRVYRSNRTEVLVDALAELLREPVGGPLEPDCVVVHGRGMAVWLSLELSRRHGVWAGDAFLYPRNFAQRIYEQVLGAQAAPAQGYRRDRLRWATASVLTALLDRPELARLKSYIAGDDAHVRIFTLAQRVADTFDQYLTYRPDMLLGWEQGDDATATRHGEDWQPIVWRALVERLGQRHLPRLERELLQACSGPDRPPELPARVAVFGITTLPPIYVRTIAAIARHCDVHLLLPSPARGFWEDLATPAEVARVQAEGRDADALHLEVGHPLLAALGRLGADFNRVLARELEALGVGEHEPLGDLYREPPARTRLGRIQADILQMQQSAHDGAPDDSLRVHSCHGPMREVEVLHDQLLALLTEGGDLAPHDIVVMMPDVDTYAPLIEAVFERDPSDPRFIPYAIADRALRRDSPVVEAFHRILALLETRAPASALLDLLTLEPVQHKLGIAPAEVDTMTRWVVESGIRWGIDAQHRAAFEQPALHENTWAFGLERLLLGYAAPGEGRRLFAGVLPYDEVEGQQAVLLGKLGAFCHRLFDAMTSMRAARTLERWRDDLVLLAETMLAHDSATAWQHQRILEALQDLCDAASAVGLDQPVGLDVVRLLLDETLQERQPARGFLAGGVTFCAMVPMRAIPFRVVCLLGMSDGAFPRRHQPTEFDLIAKLPPRAGDRSRRDDDRFLFLEAILAARDKLIITYTGQSIRDNSELPPSVMVSELLEALPSDRDVIFRHPLQPFSPRYFEDPDGPLFSYAQELCRAAQGMHGESSELASTPPLFESRLPEVPDATASLSLAELVRFFSAPVAYLMERRLGIVLRDQAAEVVDREPLELDNLERYQVGDQLLALTLEGVSEAESLALLRGSGALVHGEAGAMDHRNLLGLVQPIVDRVSSVDLGGRQPSLPIDLPLADGTALVGETGERHERGLLGCQFSRLTGKHVLAMWVRHLALCSTLPEAQASVVVGRGEGDGMLCYRLGPAHDARKLLLDLVELYRLGMREPLLLFPRTALRYALDKLARGADDVAHQRALRAASKAWKAEQSYDAYVAKVYGSHTLDEIAELVPQQYGFAAPGFVGLTERVFAPLLDHLEEL